MARAKNIVLVAYVHTWKLFGRRALKSKSRACCRETPYAISLRALFVVQEKRIVKYSPYAKEYLKPKRGVFKNIKKKL